MKTGLKRKEGGRQKRSELGYCSVEVTGNSALDHGKGNRDNKENCIYFGARVIMKGKGESRMISRFLTCNN